MTLKSFSQAINEALVEAMQHDPNVICYGLGVPDPKGIFGTTLGLQERFGHKRVFDIPTSENAMTGVGIGAALYGLRPVITHQRLDFALLSMDQLVNNAAKWRFMFGGQRGVPMTVRMIIGRGWGQGPTHSANLQAWFAHIPGLKVVMPSTPVDAKGLLLSSIFDPDPVIFLEHRWLHNQLGDVPSGDYRVPIGKARILRNGSDITVVSMSYMTVEAVRAVDFLQDHNISCELIDLRSVSPLDWECVIDSVQSTGRILVLDSGCLTCSISGEITARITNYCWQSLKCAPERLAMPDYPEATSPSMTEHYHIRAEHIVDKISTMLEKSVDSHPLIEQRKSPHDVPGDWFKGPF